MPVEMGIWRIDGGAPRRLTATTLPSEKALEDFLTEDPTLLGTRLMVIGRQVRTPHGKYIDLLAIDEEGNLHVLELKRDRTPREVVAQALDYGSWVTTLDRDGVLAIANDHLGARGPFEVAFEDAFHAPPPDELNAEQHLTVVASELDPSSERIVEYLASFGVPINAVFFSYLQDDDRRYLARSWLMSADEHDVAAQRRPSKRAEWNGRDWFVSFGDGRGRSWDDGRYYGFVSAGGGRWYSQTLHNVPVGSRVFVHVPKAGYVAVGETLRTAVRFDRAQVELDGSWVPLAAQRLRESYVHQDGLTPTDVADDDAAYVIPVRWTRAVGLDEAFWEKGMFANQLSACKLRQQFTLERLVAHFGLDE